MTIETDRLLLTEVSHSDLQDIHELHSFAEVDEFNTLGVPKNLEETNDVLAPMIEAQNKVPQTSYTWKIVSQSANEFIGIAGMNLSNPRFRSAEIYYKLLPNHWGFGFATEVSNGLIKSGFEDFKLHRIGAGVATENVKSIRVLEKSGMKREGLKRKVLPIRGSWVDNYEYAIVEDDYRIN